MRILSVVHQPDAGPGVFAEAAHALGHELIEWTPAGEGEPDDEVDAILVLGGGMHPTDEDAHPWLLPEKRRIADWLDQGKPLFGVCLGAELIGEVAGAPARRMDAAEIGWYDVELAPAAVDDPVFGVLPRSFPAFQWHSFMCPLPPGATRLAGAGERADAFRLGEAWAIQFHAEVTSEIAQGWLDRYHEDPDAVAAGIEPEEISRETGRRIAEQNELGRRLFTAFCERAAATRG